MMLFWGVAMVFAGPALVWSVLPASDGIAKPYLATWGLGATISIVASSLMVLGALLALAGVVARL